MSKKKIWKIAAGITGVGIVSLAVLYAAASRHAAKKVDQAYAELAKLGAPLALGEVVPAAVPDADNAAIAYQAITLQLKSQPVGDDNAYEKAELLLAELTDREPDGTDVEALRAILGATDFANSLAELEVAAAKSGYRQNLDYSQGAGLLLPHLSDLRTLSALVVADGMVVAADDPDLAWRRLETAFRMALHGRDEPLVVSQLVRLAQFALALDGLEAVAAVAPPSAGQAAGIDALLREQDGLAPFALALSGERVIFGDWMFSMSGADFAELAESEGASALVAGIYRRLPTFRLDHAAYLEIMLAYERVAETRFDQADLGAVEDLIVELPRYCIMTRMAAPALGSAKRWFVVRQARSRVARAGLALLRHRSDRGEFPEALAELGDVAALADPFSDELLRYRVDEDGVVVYSVGADQDDDGGVAGEQKNAADGDLYWRLK